MDICEHTHKIEIIFIIDILLKMYSLKVDRNSGIVQFTSGMSRSLRLVDLKNTAHAFLVS